MTAAAAPDGVRHEMLLYAGLGEFVERIGQFVRDGVEAGDAVLVAAVADKIGPLQEHLGREARHVTFADMNDVGRNPARIIPFWREFAAAQTARGTGYRGVGEPIHAGRQPHELAECQRHEALLNVAFPGGPSWTLLCPYDTVGLDPAIVEDALESHPFVGGDGGHNPRYRGLDCCSATLDTPFPEPPQDALTVEFGPETLRGLREDVARRLSSFELELPLARDFVLAVHELAANSVRHGGGRGTARVWREGCRIVAEVRDSGSIDDPLAGRVRPRRDASSGRGLWLVNGLCDLVEIRAYPGGSAVRVHVTPR